MNKNRECKNKNCRNEFVLNKYRSNQLYCSRDCWCISNVDRIKEVQKKLYLKNKVKKKLKPVISKKTRVNCSYCNKEKMIYPYEVKYKNHFCSLKCIGKLNSINHVGETSYSYKPIDINKLKESYENMTLGELCKLLGVGHLLIYDRLKRYNIKKKGRFKFKSSEKKIIELYIIGELNIEIIARRVGCSNRTIGRILSRNGIERRNHNVGILCYSKDNHFCRSILERYVDDFLFYNKIPHLKDPILFDNFRSDFLIGDIYIEVWGLKDDKFNYGKNKKIKEDFYKKNKLKLISIFPKDDISKKLGFLIPLFSKVQKEIISFEEK